MTKTVVIFGGSFNPAHDGHFAIMRHAHETLKPDELWMMFSINRLKDAHAYAATPHRMEMARIMAQHYPDVPVKMTDIEEQIGTNQTYFLLSALRAQNPDTRFIWLMGADNLKDFDQWVRGEDIFREFNVAIINRPGYDEQLRDSPLLKKFFALRRDSADALKSNGPGWLSLNAPEVADTANSSSALLKHLRAGETNFSGHFNDVAAYIRRHGLYGIKPRGPSPAAPRP